MLGVEKHTLLSECCGERIRVPATIQVFLCEREHVLLAGLSGSWPSPLQATPLSVATENSLKPRVHHVAALIHVLTGRPRLSTKQHVPSPVWQARSPAGHRCDLHQGGADGKEQQVWRDLVLCVLLLADLLKSRFLTVCVGRVGKSFKDFGTNPHGRPSKSGPFCFCEGDPASSCTEIRSCLVVSSRQTSYFCGSFLCVVEGCQ